MLSKADVESDEAKRSVMISADQVKGSEKLIARFGAWPSFHDSEVVSLSIIRDEGRALTAPVARMGIHVFRIEVMPDSPERLDTLITLQFRDVDNLELKNFNHQNAIIDLTARQRFSATLNRDVLQVEVVPGFGLAATFDCAEIELLSVEPFTPPTEDE